MRLLLLLHLLALLPALVPAASHSRTGRLDEKRKESFQGYSGGLRSVAVSLDRPTQLADAGSVFEVFDDVPKVCLTSCRPKQPPYPHALLPRSPLRLVHEPCNLTLLDATCCTCTRGTPQSSTARPPIPAHPITNRISPNV